MGRMNEVVNDPALMARLSNSFKNVLDSSQIIEDAPPAMASEDAHLLLGDYADVPLAYIMVGVASPEAFADAGYKPPYFNHNGDYKVELGAIPTGSHMATNTVLELLGI